ncbi:MAG: hypothetical protein IPK83_10810 [Planctomycetes bacterium]|nr:hypothetical protein [Planctomycetota bacterium]
MQTFSRLDGVVDLGRQNVHLAETLARLSRKTGIQIAYPIECELMPVDHVFGHRSLRDDLSAVLSLHGLVYRIENDGRLRILPHGELGLRDLFFRSRVQLPPQQLRDCVMGDTTQSCELLAVLLQQQRGLRESDRDFVTDRLVEAGRLASDKLVFSGLQIEVRRTRDGRVRYAMSLSGISRSPADEAGHAVSAIATLQGAIEKSDLFKADFDPPVLRQKVNSALGERISFNLILLPISR